MSNKKEEAGRKILEEATRVYQQEHDLLARDKGVSMHTLEINNDDVGRLGPYLIQARSGPVSQLDRYLLGQVRLISLCTEIEEPNFALFKAALCFWSTASNCFVFPIGTMTITIMDVTTLAGRGFELATTSCLKLPQKIPPFPHMSFQAFHQQYQPSMPSPQ
ncbi:unnamed protein product [Linum trigynum]|uniref:Uncharacterized protein n=1 Tax=Linum trigynum TaxID=586398 RepID=A0AAV2CWJ4_9ROSI